MGLSVRDFKLGFEVALVARSRSNRTTRILGLKPFAHFIFMQGYMEYIAHARSYTALFQPASAIPEKASRETNNSTATFDANIHGMAIISCNARKGRLKLTEMRALRTAHTCGDFCLLQSNVEQLNCLSCLSVLPYDVSFAFCPFRSK